MQWLQCRLLQELCPSLGRFSCDTESKRCDLLVFRVAFLGFWLCWLCQSNLQQFHQPPSVIISCSGSPWHAKCLDPSDYRNAKTTWHDAGAEGPCRERFGKVNVEKPLKIDVSKCFFLKKNTLDRDVKDLLNPPPCELFGEFLKKGVEYSHVFIDIESLFVMSFLMPFFGPVPRLNTMALCLYIPSTARTMEPSGPRKAKPVPITVMHVVMATSVLTDLQLSRRLLKAHSWWSRKVTIFCFKA